MMEVVEVSDVDAIALHPMTFLLDLDREVLKWSQATIQQEPKKYPANRKIYSYDRL
jgi:hypothetical protein